MVSPGGFRLGSVRQAWCGQARHVYVGKARLGRQGMLVWGRGGLARLAVVRQVEACYGEAGGIGLGESSRVMMARLGQAGVVGQVDQD